MSSPFRDAVVFDVDGVLIDSYQAHFDAWRMLAVETGRGDYTEAEFVAGFGCTSREVLLAQWPSDGLDEHRLRAYDDRKEALYRELVAEDFPAMDGASDLVDALIAAGFAIGVGSSGPPENVRIAIDRLGLAPRLGALVTRADVTRGKPDPQIFLVAAERLGVPPRRCVVFEDSVPGLTAAKAAGMKCIGVVSTGHTEEELSAADHRIRSLRDADAALVRRVLDR